MKKLATNNKIYIFSLALIFIAGSGLGPINYFPGPVIQWTPEKIEETQFPGTAKVFIAKFTSKQDLENVKFWLTPKLNKYATIEPANIEKVEKNKEYSLSIIVSLPSDIKTGKSFCERLEDLPKNHIDKIDKDDKDFLFQCLKNKISGLLFVTSGKKTVPWWCKFWRGGKKCDEKEVRTIHPRALKIIVNVKEPSAEEIPGEIALPNFNRIEEDLAIGQNYVKDEIIVKFKDGTSETIIKQIVRDIDGVFIGSLKELEIYQLQVSVADFNELDQKINQLEQNINIEFAGRQIATIPTF